MFPPRIMPGVSTAARCGAFLAVDPHRIVLHHRRRPAMRKKLLATLIASAFAFTAFAQAPKSDTAPKAPASGTEAKKDTTTPSTGDTTKASKKKAKGERKAKAKGKGKAKSDETKTDSKK
jgi:hypothetical protein